MVSLCPTSTLHPPAGTPLSAGPKVSAVGLSAGHKVDRHQERATMHCVTGDQSYCFGNLPV